MPQYCSGDKAEVFISANRDGDCVGAEGGIVAEMQHQCNSSGKN